MRCILGRGACNKSVVDKAPVNNTLAKISVSYHRIPMWLTKHERTVVIFNAVYITVFTWIAWQRANYEFVMYAVVVMAAALWILWKQRSVKFDLLILWGLTLWGLLHMAGGNVRLADGVLYGANLLSLFPRYHILRYDQIVHLLGFGVATLMCHHLLQPYLHKPLERWWPLAILVVLMGSGLGAINEIIEFIAVETIPETGVGGYQNTLLDLCFNLLGGIIAVMWLTLRRKPVA